MNTLVVKHKKTEHHLWFSWHKRFAGRLCLLFQTTYSSRDGNFIFCHSCQATIWRQKINTFCLYEVFTARCTLVQSAVLPSHVCLSVCPSVMLVDCDHIGWNSSKIISPLLSLGCSLFAPPTWRVCSKGNTPKFGLKVTHPLLIWASETFDRKLRPNGYR